MGENIRWAGPPTDTKEDPLFAPQMCGLGDRLRVIYALVPRAVTVRALRASARYSATYFDPVTGERRAASPIATNAHGEARLTPPPPEHDWVILLQGLPAGKAK